MSDPPDSAWLDALLGGTDGVEIPPQSQGPGPIALSQMYRDAAMLEQESLALAAESHKKIVPVTKKGAARSGDTRDSGLIPHKTSPHSLLSYDTTLRPWARFPFDSPQAPNCFAARC